MQIGNSIFLHLQKQQKKEENQWVNQFTGSMKQTIPRKMILLKFCDLYIPTSLQLRCLHNSLITTARITKMMMMRIIHSFTFCHHNLRLSRVAVRWNMSAFWFRYSGKTNTHTQEINVLMLNTLRYFYSSSVHVMHTHLNRTITHFCVCKIKIECPIITSPVPYTYPNFSFNLSILSQTAGMVA